MQHRYDDIVQWYQDLETLNKYKVKYVGSIGKSYEGRDMPAVHIGKIDSEEAHPKIYFQCQIHASKHTTITII